MIFRKILSAATPKKKFVKFEINFEEFLRVAHPSSKQGTERFSIRFLKNFEHSDLPLSDFLFFDTQDTLFHHFRQLYIDVS